MGVSYKYAKNIAKLGARLLIGLVVIDIAWTVIRSIISKAVYSDILPKNFLPIDSIIANSIFIITIGILSAGMLMLGIYYFKFSKLSLVSAVLLFIQIGIKIAFIFYQFSYIIGDLDPTVATFLSDIFELSSVTLFILTFIIFDFFQKQLKDRAGLGFGHGIIPYLFGGLGLVHLVMNILNLAGISFAELPPAAATVLHLFSYFAAILTIILFFDLLRRFDYMQPLADQDEDSIIDMKIVQQIKAEKKMNKTQI